MSKFEQKPGTGALMSKEKRTEKSPDFKGNLILDRDYKAGEEVKLSAWQKQSRMGPLISLSVDNWKPDPEYKNKVDYDQQQPRSQFSSSGSRKLLEDEIPF